MFARTDYPAKACVGHRKKLPTPTRTKKFPSDYRKEISPKKDNLPRKTSRYVQNFKVGI